MFSSDLIGLLDAAVRTSFQSLRDTYFVRLEVCTFAVVIGVLIEESEYFLSWPRVRERIPLGILLPAHRFDTWVQRISKAGWILILLGVGGEFVYEARVSRADGWLQEFNNILSVAQQTEIKGLGDITAKARSDAKLASDASKNAINDALSAVTLATESESHLKEALAKADAVATLAKGYENEIQEAKRDASEAKALLAEARRLAAEARQQAGEATIGVQRLKANRSLSNAGELSRKVREFEKTEYMFSGVFADEESIHLLTEIDDALRQAGWQRIKAPHAFPALLIFGKDDDVHEVVTAGIQISVDSPEAVAVLQTLPVQKLPPILRAAVVLNIELGSNVFPPSDPKLIDVQPGTSKTIRITIGKKP